MVLNARTRILKNDPDRYVANAMPYNDGNYENNIVSLKPPNYPILYQVRG